MDAFLTLPTEARRGLCLVAGSALGLDAASVEKDFWVCWILREMFALPETGPHLTFKGGTSLSKGWKLIERFSEDVDMVIAREFLGFSGDQAPESAATGKKRNARLDALRAACQAYIRDVMAPELAARLGKSLPSDLKWSLANDPVDPDGQTLLFDYPTVFPAGAYMQSVVRVELGARSDTEPSATPYIQPYIADALPDALGPSSFTVRAVAPERTFWEKAMLLHEESYRHEGPKRRLSRHYYDLWCLIRGGIAEQALADKSLFERVASHRAIFFRRSREAQETLRRGSLRLMPRQGHFPLWQRDYDAMREVMFFGEAPEFVEVVAQIEEFQNRFNRP